ncbi:MAG: nucleotidyl transferase AbiEii/AbiGii toxin family protein [Acidiferrobacter sp.]
MSTFEPRWNILPAAQKRLWHQLRRAADLGFVLYGGTAIALRLGHRTSIDFDFFSERPVDRDAIKGALPFMARATSLLDKGDTWSVIVPCGDSEPGSVHVSFFGNIGFGRVGQPDISEDGVLQVASLEDLIATKVKVVLQRAEAKDYRDIAAMLQAGVSLAHGLAAARLIFGPTFQPSESLKALVYFEDGDLHTLTAIEKSVLVNAATAVGDLPEVTLLSWRLTHNEEDTART